MILLVRAAERMTNEDRAAGLCLRVALPRQSVLGRGNVKTCMRAMNGR